MSRIFNRRNNQRIAKVLIWAAAFAVILVMLAIIVYVLGKGLPVINWHFLTQQPSDAGRAGGISSAIVGTLAVTLVAILVATPLGVGTAFYLTEYARETTITKIIRFSAECLAGVPSIVYGLFGFIVFVIYLKLGWSILSGGFTLAIMVLPTIIRTTEEAIRAVPKIYREVSFSLGGSRWQTITRAVVPSALPGITTGIILSIGRCVGETAAVILTAGSTLRMPTSPLSPTRTMAVHFYILAREGISIDIAYGTAALLIISVLIIDIAANILVRVFVAKVR
ncbi:MAG TPA: phosphate ABC transporter permease PstA [Dehalococcoidales bacterium]|nr:phosphate ABC transporter permease PstA [Dehalococcoidales bacterium]